MGSSTTLPGLSSDADARARALPSVAILMGNSFFQLVVLRVKRQGCRQDPHSPSLLWEEGIRVSPEGAGRMAGNLTIVREARPASPEQVEGGRPGTSSREKWPSPGH